MEINGSTSKNIYKILIVVAAALLMFGGRYLPWQLLSPAFTPSMAQVLCIFVSAVILWLTIAIDWPAILVLLALSTVPELSFNTLLQQTFGSETFAFLFFTFILTYALGQTSLLKRLAWRFISARFAARSPWHFVSAYCGAILFIGSFISPTVLFFLFLPLLEEIYRLFNLKKGDSFAALLMLCTVIMCGISSGMTPIAHAFPLIALSLYEQTFGVAVSALHYISVALPVGLLSALLIIVLFYYLLPQDLSFWHKFKAAHVTAAHLTHAEHAAESRVLSPVKVRHFGDKAVEASGKTVGKRADRQAELFINEPFAGEPLQKGEIIIAAVFAAVVLLWILPGDLFGFVLKTPLPPMIGIVCLSLLPDGKSGKLLNLGEAMAKGVSWPSLLMCTGTLALGAAFTNKDILLSEFLKTALSPFLSQFSGWMPIFLFCFFTALMTNFSSNMVTATVMTTLALAIAPKFPDLNIAALTILIGLLSSCAFAAPPAMPCVAIAGSSGYIDARTLFKYGLAAMGVLVVIASCLGYPLASALL